jgi:hypothetical protein
LARLEFYSSRKRNGGTKNKQISTFGFLLATFYWFPAQFICTPLFLLEINKKNNNNLKRKKKIPVTDSLPKKGDRLFLKNFIFFLLCVDFKTCLMPSRWRNLKKKNLRDATWPREKWGMAFVVCLQFFPP